MHRRHDSGLTCPESADSPSANSASGVTQRTPPAVGSCASNLGEAKTYGISFLTGGLPAGRTSISTVLTGGGLAPSPVGGVVDLGKPDGSEGGQKVAFCIGCGKKDRLEPERPNIVVPSNRQKIYWNMKNDG